jgi:hypothetical protein
MKFKVGDMVRILDTNGSFSPFSVGDIREIRCVSSTHVFFDYNGIGNCCNCGKHTWEIKYEQVELINNNYKNMNIKEKFITAFLSEPEKSFRKAGITNGDGFLTEDGQSMFLSWLLKKDWVAFKKDVVDELLKEDK